MWVYVVKRKRINFNGTWLMVDIYASKDNAKQFVASKMKSNNRDYNYRWTKRKVK